MPDFMEYGQFATRTLRYGQFATRTVRYMDSSLHGQFATWTVRYMDSSLHGQFATWTVRYTDCSLHGQFATWIDPCCKQGPIEIFKILYMNVDYEFCVIFKHKLCSG